MARFMDIPFAFFSLLLFASGADDMTESEPKAQVAITPRNRHRIILRCYSNEG